MSRSAESRCTSVATPRSVAHTCWSLPTARRRAAASSVVTDASADRASASIASTSPRTAGCSTGASSRASAVRQSTSGIR